MNYFDFIRFSRILGRESPPRITRASKITKTITRIRLCPSSLGNGVLGIIMNQNELIKIYFEFVKDS